MLNQIQKNSYKENGFLVVHNLLSKEEIENFLVAQGGGNLKNIKNMVFVDMLLKILGLIWQIIVKWSVLYLNY